MQIFAFKTIKLSHIQVLQILLEWLLFVHKAIKLSCSQDKLTNFTFITKVHLAI